MTATKYLDALANAGFLSKHRVGRGNYYINVAFNAILQPPASPPLAASSQAAA